MSKGRRVRADRTRQVGAAFAVPAGFRALGEHLTGLADALDSLNAGPYGAAAPAYVDVADEAHGPLLRSRPGLEASLLPHQTISYTCDHLRGIGALVRTPRVVLSPLSLLRPAAESAGTAFYLLEPGIGTHERVRRWGNVQLQALVEQERLHVGDADASLGEHAAERARLFVEQAAARGYDVRGQAAAAGGWPKARSLGTPAPSAQRLVTGMLGDIAGDVGPFYHRFLSAITHGQPHGLLPFLGTDAAQPGESPTVTVSVEIGLADLAMWVSVLVRGVGAVEGRASCYYDWDGRQWAQRYQDALVDLARWMHAGP